MKLPLMLNSYNSNKPHIKPFDAKESKKQAQLEAKVSA